MLKTNEIKDLREANLGGYSDVKLAELYTKLMDFSKYAVTADEKLMVKTMRDNLVAARV